MCWYAEGMSKAHEVLAQAFTTSSWAIEKPRDGHQKECYIASDGNRTVFVKFDVPITSLQRLSELAVAPRVLASGIYQGTSYVIQEVLAGTYPDRRWIRSHVTEVADLIRTYHEDKPLAEILAQAEAPSYRQHLDDDLAVLELRVASHAHSPLQVAFYKLKELAQSFDDAPLVPVHNEPNAKNMLVHGGKLTFIDWDEVLLADPLRDIGVFLWWYLPIPQWQDFFKSFGAPLTPSAETRVYWFAARASLAICLWHMEHGSPAGAFYEDFFAALDRQPNPHSPERTVDMEADLSRGMLFSRD
jgi:thiamine kinase-like enzyme